MDSKVTAQEKLFLNVRELAAYLGMGITRAAEYGVKCGAKRKYGARALYRRDIVEEAVKNDFMMDTPAPAATSDGAIKNE